MPVLRHHHTKDYTIIPNSLIRDENLSTSDVGLLIFMLSLPEDWEFSVCGLSSLLRHDGVESVKSSVKRIKAAGYLKMERERKGGKFARTVWTVSDFPIFTVCVKTACGETVCGKSVTNKGLSEQRTD